jgi:bacillopeptidase F
VARLDRTVVAIAVVAAVALAGGAAFAGSLEPELEALIGPVANGDEVPVIVELAGRVQTEALVFPTKRARRRGVVATLRTRAGIAEPPVRAFLEARGSTPIRSLWAVGGLAATVAVSDLRDLADLPAVASVRLDRSFRSLPPVPKAAADGGWNLEAVGAPDLWANGIDGAGVVVAIVDSGVDGAHADLGPRWRGGDNSWFDPFGEHGSPYDPSGHGTQVAGLVVGGDASGTAIGVAPGARWIAAKNADDSGQSTLSATHEIFQWLLDPDGDPATDDAPDVVNNSWGFRDLPGQCVDEFTLDIQILRSAGIAVVFSAGNAGPGTSTSLSPANNPGAFSVGGTDEQDQVMSSSSRGPSACDGSIFPTLVAPGDGVLTADLTLGGIFADATTEVQGTSFAAPHVTGAAALLLSAHPDGSVEQIEQALLAGAEDLGPDGPDHDSGFGRLDVVKAERELAALVGGAGQASVYTDEAAFLTAIAGQESIAEGFEDDIAWGMARLPDTATSVDSQGVTWASNHPENEVTTGIGPAYTGGWGFYSIPHGDQTVTQPNDFIIDGFTGSATTAMNAVGGWFVATSGSRLALILDGDETNAVDLGPVGVEHGFLGVVVEGSFTTFEFRETEGTVEDQKFIFVDDVTIGVAGDGSNRPPDGTILRPLADLDVAVGEPVFFEGEVFDPDGDPVTVVWDFGDGFLSTDLIPGNRSYGAAGSYTVSFTATDDRGLSDPTPDTRLVMVTESPAAGPTGVVAGVANFPGAAGSDWHTDLYLHNASSSSISLEVSFSPSGGVPGIPTTLTVEPDHTTAIEDVVATLFGVTGSGAIHWTVVSGDSARLLVSANTYNRVDDNRRYGQQVPGIRWSDAAPSSSSIWLPALAGPYRTNLGFATDQDCTRVNVRGYDRNGTQVAQRALQVSPLTWVQLNGIFRNVFPGLIADPDTVALADSVHRFEVVGENGRVVAYTSVIDNETSDGSYMLGQVPIDGARRSWLPGAATVSGANDSRWRSDVILMHTDGAGDGTGFAFFEAGPNPGGPVDTRQVAPGSGGVVVQEDILGALFGLQPPVVGSLLATSQDIAAAVTWMRTYTEESLPGGGVKTYGQAVVPGGSQDVITGAGGGRISGFNHHRTSRCNLILQNTRSADGAYLASTIRIEVFTATGQLLYQRDYALAPGEYLQHNRFLDDYGIGDLSNGWLRVTALHPPVPGDTGGVEALVSEVNGNLVDGTNDGRLIRAEVSLQ